MILTLLYWIILVLSLVGVFSPPSWPYGWRIMGGAATLLFIIIGLRLFRTPIS